MNTYIICATLVMRLGIIPLTILLTLSAAVPQDIPEEQVDQEQLEREEQQLEESEWQSNVAPWIAQELEAERTKPDQKVLDSFLVSIPPGASYFFRWRLPNKKKPVEFRIRVFTQEEGNDVTLMRNPEESQFVHFEYKDSMEGLWLSGDKVYVNQEFSIPGAPQKYIKLSSSHEVQVLAQVCLLGSIFEVDPSVALKNDDLKLAGTKLDSIYQQLRGGENSRARMFKWQWGFIEREEHYEAEMLKLTAVELLVILGTAVIQIFCIKSLFGEHSII